MDREAAFLFLGFSDALPDKFPLVFLSHLVRFGD
jgi:hypothetical protein